MKNSSSLQKLTLLCLALALPAGLFLTGCQSSTRPGSNSLASVVINNTTIDTVRKETIAVFEHNMWTLREEKEGVIAFEREGTRRDSRLYGGWDKEVWMRAEVRIQPYGNALLVRCDAFAITDHGDPFVETKSKIHSLSAGTYEDMLETVKKKCGFKP
jgi:hypothetical protein